jgi:signal transduction histidine kinase
VIWCDVSPARWQETRTWTTRIGVEDDGPGFGAIPVQNSIGLKVVGKTLSKAGGRLEVSYVIRTLSTGRMDMCK